MLWIKVKKGDRALKSMRQNCSIVPNCCNATHVTTASPPAIEWVIAAITSLSVSLSASWYVRRCFKASGKCCSLSCSGWVLAFSHWQASMEIMPGTRINDKRKPECHPKDIKVTGIVQSDVCITIYLLCLFNNIFCV